MNLQGHSLAESRSRSENIRTVVVDDSPLMLKVVAQILASERNFALVGAATDGCQALRRVLDLSPDLVLMDFRLPHLNGIQAAHYIKQFENPPVIIIITSDENPNVPLIAKEAGADAFVVKGDDFRIRLKVTLQELFGLNDEGGERVTGIDQESCLASHRCLSD